MSINRRREREIVFEMLFSSQFSPEKESQEIFDTFAEESDETGIADSEYIREVFFGARDYIPTAVELISSAAVGWKIERLSKTTLTILELALFEMNEYDKVLKKVSINEAVELAKKFDDEKAPKFINGILGTLSGEKE